MDQNQNNNIPKKSTVYKGGAFWDTPAQDLPPVQDISVPAYQTGDTPGGAPAENGQNTPTPVITEASAFHPVITPQKPSAPSNKKVAIIIAAAAVVILAITAVVIITMTSGKTPQPSAVQPTVGQIAEELAPDDTPAADKPTERAFEKISMPACENRSLDTVKAQLEELGLAVSVERVFSDDIAKDYIVSQSVPRGTELAVGSSVLLTVSDGADVSPYDYAQKLTVSASRGSSYGTATLYEWKNGDWTPVASYSASVGSNGIGPAREGSSTSPQGLHKLGVVLSSGSVNTNLRTYSVTSNTCVIDDASSSYYNQIMEKSSVPSGVHYDNIGKGLTDGSTYATIYIEHNGSGFSSENVVSGNGSAIGLRGQYGSLSPTYGDVDISARDMQDLLSRLDASKNPMIEITAN